MTEKAWFRAPIVDLLSHACSIPTVASRWLEGLRRFPSIGEPVPVDYPRPGRWAMGSRGRKHVLLTLAITRLYWAHLSQRTREVLDLHERLEELPEPPNDEKLVPYECQLSDFVQCDADSVPESVQLNGIAELSAISVGQWTDLDDFMKRETSEYESWRPLIYDIFGNPFRKVKFNKKWRTSTAVALAKQMHESRDFSAMPILADALQDAGCNNTDVLSHCRDEKQIHVRGCWVVDLVLGKE